MDIVFCSPLLSYHGGHFIRFAIERARSMVAAGVNVRVVGYPSDVAGTFADAKVPYISVRGAMCPACRRIVDGIARRFGNAWICIAEHLWVVWCAVTYAKKHGVPLVYISDMEPWIIVLLAILGKIGRGPRVAGFIMYPFYVEGMKAKNFFEAARCYLNQISLPRLPRYIDVICDDEFIAESIYKKSLDRIHIVSDGFVRTDDSLTTADARCKLELPADQRIVLLFGVRSRFRGAEFLAQALKQIAPSFYVCVVGEIGRLFNEAFFTGSDPSKGAWRKHLRVVDRFVSEEERELYFQACDAVVLPHRFGHTCSTGNLRDAVSHGKAIVASDQFYMGHIVKSKNLGLTFPPENVAALKECLVSLARMPDTWLADIERRSKAVVASNSCDGMGVRYKELFEQIAAIIEIH